MLRGVKAKQNENKGRDKKLQRSRSKSPQRSKDKLSPQKSKKKLQKSASNRNLNKSRNNPSLARSVSKKSLVKSKSSKNLKKDLSQPKLNNSQRNVKSSLPPKQIDRKKSPIPSKKQPVKESPKLNQSQIPKLNQSQVPNNIKHEEKEMGLVFFRPQHDKVVFKSLESTDDVFEKYLDMVNNDNDTNYVMNALPELKELRKDDDTDGRDFVSGRISRLSGIFEHLTVDKIITPMKRVPQYYHGQCGKNLICLKITLQTKFKVQVDLGFLLYSLDGDKLTVFRVYVSKIYRRMNYVGFVYMEMFRALMQKQSSADRWSIFILERNANVHKFFKYLGFKIEKIASESKNKTVEYFQEFSMKKKQLQTVLASMK